MFKVEEVAKELNISRQAVYKKLNKESIQEYIVTIDGVKHLSTEGLEILKGKKPKYKEAQTLSSDEVETLEVEKVESEVAITTNFDNTSGLVNILNNVIESKDKDINHLREENKKLLDLMQQQNQLLLNSQKLQEKSLSNTELLLLEKRQQLLERQAQSQNTKKGFFAKLRYVFSR